MKYIQKLYKLFIITFVMRKSAQLTSLPLMRVFIFCYIINITLIDFEITNFVTRFITIGIILYNIVLIKKQKLPF